MDDLYWTVLFAVMSALLTAAWRKPVLYRAMISLWVWCIAMGFGAGIAGWNILISSITSEITQQIGHASVEAREVLASMLIPYKWSMLSFFVVVLNILLSYFAKRVIETEHTLANK